MQTISRKDLGVMQKLTKNIVLLNLVVTILYFIGIATLIHFGGLEERLEPNHVFKKLNLTLKDSENLIIWIMGFCLIILIPSIFIGFTSLIKSIKLGKKVFWKSLLILFLSIINSIIYITLFLVSST